MKEEGHCILCNKMMGGVYSDGWFKGVPNDDFVGYKCINIRCKRKGVFVKR